MSFVHPPDTGQFVPDGFVAVALGTAVKPKTPGIDRELAQPTNASALAVLEPGGPVHEGAKSSPLAPVPTVGDGSRAAESPISENCSQICESDFQLSGICACVQEEERLVQME